MVHVICKSERYYASSYKYPLPADSAETSRLNLQHPVVARAFEDRLSLAPLELNSGSRVLESAAGTGIWALEFFTEHLNRGVTLDMECFDISDKQFPTEYHPGIRFSVMSVADLPAAWTNTFTYIHQRFLVSAMTESRWYSALSELFRVLEPGGWIELVEVEAEHLCFGVGPHSKKLCSLINNMYHERKITGDVSGLLPSLMKQVGFTDFRAEARIVPIGGSKESGYTAQQWYDLHMGMKQPVIQGGGYGIIETAADFDTLMKGSLDEWKNSVGAHTVFYDYVARKPLKS